MLSIAVFVVIIVIMSLFILKCFATVRRPDSCPDDIPDVDVGDIAVIGSHNDYTLTLVRNQDTGELTCVK